MTGKRAGAHGRLQKQCWRRAIRIVHCFVGEDWASYQQASASFEPSYEELLVQRDVDRTVRHHHGYVAIGTETKKSFPL